MSYRPDEHDLERSHELERRLDRDAEREPFRFRTRRARCPRYFSGLMFRPFTSVDTVPVVGRKAA
jgi:hypothetical protein